MTTHTLSPTKEKTEIEALRTKAAILDDLIELIEDKYLGYLMRSTEKEENVSLTKAKRLLR